MLFSGILRHIRGLRPQFGALISYFMKNLSSTLVLLATLFSAASQTAVAANEPKLVTLSDLQYDAAQAEAKKLPILVFYSASYCSYCSIVKEEFLKPMLKSGDYTDKVIIRVVEIDSSDEVRDLNGKLIDSEDYADKHNVSLTPTLTFINPNDKELAPRLVGVTTLDFYGGYLDDAIDASLVQLRGHKIGAIDSTTAPKL